MLEHVLAFIVIVITGLAVAYFWLVSADHVSRSHAVLPYSPNQISSVEISKTALLLLVKSTLPGFAPTLKPADGSTSTFSIPVISLKGELSIQDAQIKLFRAAVRETDDSLINPLFLFAQLNPLVILLLAHTRCPMKPLGAVNTKNTFLYMQPQLCCDTRALQAAASAGRLLYEARIGHLPATRQKRGVEFTITIELFVDGQLLMSMDMSFLQFLPKSFRPRFAGSAPQRAEFFAGTSYVGSHSESVDMDIKDPKRWAASCKDYNPIHISATGARLLGGFRNVIAHGNHLTSLAIKAGSPASPKRVHDSNGRHDMWKQDSPVLLTVEFLRPAVLPLKAHVETRRVSPHKEVFVISKTSNPSKPLIQAFIELHEKSKS